jgi:hypothetical protein
MLVVVDGAAVGGSELSSPVLTPQSANNATARISIDECFTGMKYMGVDLTLT